MDDVKKDSIKSMVRDLYQFENPEKAKRLTETVLDNIIDTYDGDFKKILENFYENENPEKAQRLNDSVFSNIAQKYKLDVAGGTQDKQPTDFKEWWNNNPNVVAWRNEFIDTYGEEPQLEGAGYDYRGAFEAGIVPEKNPYDNKYHWGSIGLEGKDLKSKNHPTRWKSEYMKLTGNNPDENNISFNDAINKYPQLNEFNPKSGNAGLINKKEELKTEDNKDIAVPFAMNAGLAATEAENPTMFLFDANSLKKRLEALPKYFPQLTDQSDELKKQLLNINSQNIDDIKQSVTDLEKQVMQLKPASMMLGQQMAGDPNWSKYENEVLKDKHILAGQRLMEDTEKLKKLAEIPLTREQEGFWDKTKAAIKGLDIGKSRGVTEYVTEYNKLLDDFKAYPEINKIYEKIEKLNNNEDVDFTTDERLLMQLAIDNAVTHRKLDDKISTYYKIGESLGKSIGFQLEFLLTSAVGGKPAGAIAKTAMKAGMKKVPKYSLLALSKLTQAGIQTTTMPSFYKLAAQNASHGMSYGEAVLNAYWEMGAETLSERIFMKPAGSIATMNGFNKFLARTGINIRTDKGALGVILPMIEETGEDKIGEILTAPKNYKDFGEFWKGFTDAEDNAVMLGSVSLMVGGMGSVSVLGNNYLEAKRKGRLARYEKFVPTDLRAEIDAVLEIEDLSVKDQYDLIADAISDRIETGDLGEDPATTAGNAMAYMNYRIQDMAAETVNKKGKVEGNRLVVGKAEEGDTEAQQAQLDYLKQRGVEVPEGTKMDELGKLYDAEVAKETAEVEIDEAETPEQVEEIKGKIEKDVDLLKKLGDKKEFITEKEKLDESLDKEEISETEYENKLEEITDTYEGEVAEKVEPVKPEVEVKEGLEQKKVDIEKRRKEDPTIERGVLINYESKKSEKELQVIADKLKKDELSYDDVVKTFFNLYLNILGEVKDYFNDGTLADKIQYGLDVRNLELSDATSKTKNRQTIESAKQRAISEKQKAEEALKNSEYKTTKKRDTVTGQVTEVKVKRTAEEKTKYENFHKKILDEANKSIEEYDTELAELPKKETVKPETEKKLAEKKTEISEIQPTESVDITESRRVLDENINNLGVNIKLVSDFMDSFPISKKSLTDITKSDRQVMESFMLGLSDHSKVLDAVISLIPVDVMNDITGGNISPQEFFNNKAMLRDAIASDSKHSIISSFFDSLISTTSATVISELNLGRIPKELLSTKIASDFNLATHIENIYGKDKIKKGKKETFQAKKEEKGVDIQAKEEKAEEHLVQKKETVTPEYEKLTTNLGIKGKTLTKSLGKSARNGKIGGVSVIMQQGTKENEVILESIKTPKYQRGTGKATGAMNKIIAEADKQGLTIKLRAVPEKGADISQENLIKFYQDFGFEFKEGSIEGIRTPKKDIEEIGFEELGINKKFSEISESKIGNIYGVEFLMMKEKGRVVIESIITPKSERKQGRASAAMDKIINMADKKEIELKLEAIPETGAGISIEQLKRFYEKKGFIFDGDIGIRKPKKKGVQDAEKIGTGVETSSRKEELESGEEGRIRLRNDEKKSRLEAEKGKKAEVEQFTPTEQLKTAKEKLKTKLKGQKFEKYIRQVDKLFNPNKTNIVEYRGNGVVTHDADGKYTFHALADMDMKEWRVAWKSDVTDQYVSEKPEAKPIEKPKRKTENDIAIDQLKNYAKSQKTGDANIDRTIDAIIGSAIGVGADVYSIPKYSSEFISKENFNKAKQQIDDVVKNKLTTEEAINKGYFAVKTPKQREEAAKAKIAEGFSNLAETIGAKKSLTGEERETAIQAITRIIEGLIELGIAKGMSLKDAVRDYLKQQNYIVDEDLLDEAIKRREKPKDDFPIGTTNAKVRTSREMRGLEAIPKEERIGNEELWRKVVDKIDNGEIFPRQAVKEIVISDDVETSAMKEAIVKHDRWRILKETKYTNEEIIKKQNSQNKKGLIELFQRRVELENEMQENDLAAEKLGATWGRAGQFRQRNVEEDLSFEAIKREAKILNGGIELTIKQEQKFKQLSEKYKELQKEYDKIREKERIREQQFKEEEEKKRKEAEQKLLNDIRNKVTPKSAKGVRDFDTQFKSDFNRQKLSQKENDIKERLKERLSRLANVKFAVGEEGASLIVEEISGVIQDMSELGIIKLEQGIDKIISKVKDYLRSVNKNFDVKNLDKYKDEIKNKLGIPEIENAEYDELINKLVDKSQSGFDISVKGILKKILYNRVVAGSETIDDVVDDIYESVKDRIPNIDKRMIRDALSGYGEFRRLSKEEIDVKIRELKRQGRLDSAIEDVEDNRLPLRSGVERDKTTQETREKQTRIIKEIKDRDLVPPPTQQDQETQWRNGLQAYQRRLENAIEDVKKEIDTGERKQKSKFKKYDTPELESLREELSRLREIRNAIDKETGRYAEQRESAILKATERVIAEIEMDIDKLRRGVPIDKNVIAKRQGLFGLSKPMQEKFTSDRIEELGKLKDALQRQLSELLPDAIKDKALLDKYKKQRQRRLEQLLEQQRTKDYGVKPKPYRPALDKEAIMINRDIEKLKYAIEKEKEQIRYKNMNLAERIGEGFINAWNIPKALMASIDLSAPMRQGIVMISKPKIFMRSFKEMFKYAFSEKIYENWLFELKTTDDYYEMISNDLYIAEPTAKLAAKEEDFMSNWLKYIDKIPLYGAVRVGSERAYVGFLNKLRVDTYLNFKDKLQKQGFEAEELQNELKSYSHFINTATGRGKLKMTIGNKEVLNMEPIAALLNSAFFSPRLIASRLAMFNPAYYTSMSKEARKDAVKTYLGTVGIIMSTLALTAIAFSGDDKFEIELDPRSSDFLKIKYGKIRYDLWGGHQQVARTLAQIITGKIKTGGEVKAMTGDKWYGQTRLKTLMRFFENKLSPSTALAKDLLQGGKNYEGEDITITNELINKTMPLYLKDVKEAVEEEGWEFAFIAGFPALFGVGVQTYGGREVDVNENEETERAIRGGY
jgi:hypothetical protein